MNDTKTHCLPYFQVSRILFHKKYMYRTLIYLGLMNFAGSLAFGYLYLYPITRSFVPSRASPFDSYSQESSGITFNLSGLVNRQNIFFLKTHKTASSSVQNILMRFGLRHSLDFLLSKSGNYLGYKSPISDADLQEELTPWNKKFNIFAHHSRYRESTDRYLHNNTIRITILRYPPHNFESMYHHFTLSRKYNKSLQELIATLPQTNVSFERKKYYLNGYNQMSYDLGLQTYLMEDEEAVRAFVKYIDSQFDYVMITEHMVASLVMLADQMGWPLEYVSSIPLMKRVQRASQYQLTLSDERKLSQLNHADTVLYNHFLQKFRQHIQQYGISRLIEDINRLRRINLELVRKCVQGTDRSGFSQTIGYKLKDSSNWDCVYSTKSELKFTAELRREQEIRLKTIKSINNLMNKTVISNL